MSTRFYRNTYSDYQNENYLDAHNQLNLQLNTIVNQWIFEQIQRVEENLHLVDRSDGTVYTGGAGIALLYLHLAQTFPDRKKEFLEKSKDLITIALKQLDERVITFLCGAPGPLAIGAVLHHHLGDETARNKLVEKILSMKSAVLRKSQPNEYLYGRVGYLYTLLFLREHIGDHIIPDDIITEIFILIIQSGEQYAQQRGSRSPLMYQWYNTEYLGAAHGVAGIVYLLLKITQHPSFAHLRSYVHSHLLPTVEYLKSKRSKSGNYMSANDDRSDELVQWCHGAPGFIYVFLKAFQITGEKSYLDHALLAGDVVWERGLLTKGYGLCHGASGNAYPLISLFQVTNDMKWLHRTLKFAEFCLTANQRQLRKEPDCPYSLFEGLSGTIYFMADLIHPRNARFPAFQ